MKATKRILSVMLAVMLILALSVTASATGSATLNVTGDQLGGRSVTIVPMFTKTGDNGTYELAGGWAGFFADRLAGVTSADDPTIPAKAFEYVSAITTESEDMVAFAKAAKAYYLDNTDDFTVATETADADTNTATFSNLEEGSYLILPASGSTATNRGTDAVIWNVTAAGSNDVAIKSVYPTVDKKVSTDGTNFTDDTAASVGDTVTFELISAVPDMTEYSSYKFSFVDTMSSGLEYVDDSVSVKIGIQTLTATDYTVKGPTSNNVLTIDLGDLKTLVTNNVGINEGDSIVVTYQATITADAVTTGSAPNQAQVVYSNNPSNPTQTEPSTPDISTVYVYDMVIDKFTTDGGTEKKLAGAVFEISNTSGVTAIQLVETTTADTYRVATADEIADTSVTKVTQVVTPSTGLITILGLSADTYYLKEVTPPAGYNGIENPIKVEITSSVDGTTGQATVTYKVNDSEQADHTVRVENNPGVTLPTTGSVGTVIFTVIGVGVIIAGVMFTSRKKKEDK